MESAAAFAWNRWQACYGISGSFAVERVAALPWNQWQDSPGISGSFAVEYAPGIGKLLRLVLLYDMHDIARFPRGQDCASSCRLVTCAKESAGKRSGTSGSNMGNAPLTWACSEAAVFFLRDHPAAQTCLARFEKTRRKGKALTILAHTVARAVYDR